MKSKRIPRLSPAMVVACLALGVALSGTGYAVTALPRNSVGPAQLKANAVNSAKVKNRSLRIADFARGQLPAGPRGTAGPQGAAGSTGAQGPQGNPGAKGDPGEPATRLWAVISSAGATIRHSGSISSANLGTGFYEVIFNRDVSACSYQATQGELSGVTGEVVVQPRSTNVNGVFVGTATSGGVSANRMFHLAVFC